MPRDIDVAFVAIDEIQLANDLEPRPRLHRPHAQPARPRGNTGARRRHDACAMVEKLLPGANILSRPRMSTLNFAGEKNLTRLPRRTAIVTFSADEVLRDRRTDPPSARRSRGGARLAFAAHPQCAGRALSIRRCGLSGRDRRDRHGAESRCRSRGVRGRPQVRRLSVPQAQPVRTRPDRRPRRAARCATAHSAPPAAVRRSNPNWCRRWRATRFDSVESAAMAQQCARLRLARRIGGFARANADRAGAARAPIAEDIQVLEHLSRDEDVRALAPHRAPRSSGCGRSVRSPTIARSRRPPHAELAVTLYGFLMREGTYPGRLVRRAGRTGGPHRRRYRYAREPDRPYQDLDLCGKPSGLARRSRALAGHRARASRTSSPTRLHERLAERFVDRRTSVLMRRLRENTMLETEITKTGEVVVEGHPIGRLAGFQFAADAASAGPKARRYALPRRRRSPARSMRAPRGSASAPDEQFALASDGALRWQGEAVAKLTAGEEMLRPRAAHSCR